MTQIETGPRTDPLDSENFEGLKDDHLWAAQRDAVRDHFLSSPEIFGDAREVVKQIRALIKLEGFFQAEPDSSSPPELIEDVTETKLRGWVQTTITETLAALGLKVQSPRSRLTVGAKPEEPRGAWRAKEQKPDKESFAGLSDSELYSAQRKLVIEHFLNAYRIHPNASGSRREIAQGIKDFITDKGFFGSDFPDFDSPMLKENARAEVSARWIHDTTRETLDELTEEGLINR